MTIDFLKQMLPYTGGTYTEGRPTSDYRPGGFENQLPKPAYSGHIQGPPSDEQLQRHLQRKDYFLGVAMADEYRRCQCSVFDIDCKTPDEVPKRDELLKKVTDALARDNVPFLICSSGSGYGFHVWVFFSQRVRKSFAKLFLRHYVLMTEEHEKLETFPHRGDEYPENVALPLGRRSEIIGEAIIVPFDLTTWKPVLTKDETAFRDRLTAAFQIDDDDKCTGYGARMAADDGPINFLEANAAVCHQFMRRTASYMPTPDLSHLYGILINPTPARTDTLREKAKKEFRCDDVLPSKKDAPPEWLTGFAWPTKCEGDYIVFYYPEKAAQTTFKAARSAKDIDFEEAFRCASRAYDADDRDKWIGFAFTLKAARDFPQDMAKELWSEWSATSDKFDAAKDPGWWDQPSNRNPRIPDWVFWRRAQRNGYVGRSPLAKGEKYDEELLDKLLDTYKVVTYAGRTSIWRIGVNEEFGSSEWIEMSPADMELENHMDSTVKAFLKDSSKPIYRNGFVFDPTTDKWPDGAINRWTGWKVRKPTAEETASGFPLLEHHMREILFNDALNGLPKGGTACYDYAIKWCAWLVQHPNLPAEVAMVARGMKGNGKSKFGEILRNFAPQHSLIFSKPEQLVGRFTNHIPETIFQEVDEGALTDRKTEGALKNLITTGVISNEAKGRDIKSRRVAAHIYITANEKWIVPSGPQERRFFVVDTGPKRDPAYYTALIAAVGDEKKSVAGTEVPAFFEHLRNVDLKGWHPSMGIPQTIALQDQRINTEAWGIEGRIRDWLRMGVLPGTHPAFVDANCLLKSRGVMALTGRFTPQQIGIVLRDYVTSRRIRLRVKSAVTQEYATKQVHVWEWMPLQEARLKFDPHEPWDDIEEWSHEYDEYAVIPDVEDPDCPF